MPPWLASYPHGTRRIRFSPDDGRPPCRRHRCCIRDHPWLVNLLESTGPPVVLLTDQLRRVRCLDLGSCVHHVQIIALLVVQFEGCLKNPLLQRSRELDALCQYIFHWQYAICVHVVHVEPLAEAVLLHTTTTGRPVTLRHELFVPGPDLTGADLSSGRTVSDVLGSIGCPRRPSHVRDPIAAFCA